MSDLENIRLKRLAKLQRSSSGENVSNRSRETSEEHESKKPNLKQDEDKTTVSSPPTEKKKETVVPSRPSNQQLKAFSREEWVHVVTCQTLNITLDSEDKGKFYLESFKKDLESEGRPCALNEDNVDSALLTRLSTTGDNTFKYLLNSWSSVYNVLKKLPKDEHLPFKTNYLTSLKYLLVSYAGITILLPDTFNCSSIDFADLLTKSPGIPPEFIVDFVARYENEGLDEFFVPVLESLSVKISLMNVETFQMNVIQVLFQLISLKPIAVLVPQLPSWCPSTSPGELEYKTFLGRISSLSVFTQEVANRYFSNSRERSMRDIASSISSLGLIVSSYQEQLYQIISVLIRTSSEIREKVLDFLAMVVNVNHKRQSLHVDQFNITSDACMLNLAYVMNRLSEPFLDIKYSKIDRVQPEYLRRHPRIDFKEETKLNADQKSSEEFFSHGFEGPNNFISDIFFINLSYHHFGINAAVKALEQTIVSIRDSEKLRERLEAEQTINSNTFLARRLSAQIDRLHQRIDLDRSFVHCYEIMLAQPSETSRSYSFLNFVMAWLLRVANNNASDYPKAPIVLPFSDSAPELFKNLPEYFIEAITDYVLSLFKTSSSTLNTHPLETLCEFCVTLLTKSSYIKNPYLRAKLVEILFYGVQTHPGQPDVMTDVLSTSKVATKWLIPALMGFYIEIESTGQSTQFYDKFNIRFYICEVFRTIWKLPAYFGKLEQEQKTNLPFFVKFVALMLNDATYLLDEALLKLKDIHNLQERVNEAINTGESNQNVQESQQNLVATERQASVYCQLGNETIMMLRLFTSSIPKAFCALEIVERLAAMLNYNLQALCGPRCRNLKVRDPTKYNFDPKSLLSTILDVYLNLCNEGNFVEAVAHDGRSYNKEIFERAIGIVKKHNLKSSLDIETILNFVNEVEKFRLKEENEEEDMGEAPDHFLDPLMFTIMKDPVILPRSGVSIDKSTIKAHLLSDNTDPFNRTPLTLDDVTPNDALREEIEAYMKALKEKRAKRNE
ncbi:ubiquitin-protein ligase E4 [Schizosaccharomyces cryophilus OY26]|uniref:RING-type E3 ubiquitin transferase n=1 Tax=Schizosaccharomyces cryophilus (strain OY26 / ATCC MYA-4695 / CBS 11777 / NBRC 106824 / NRRL Y48691) TaxID=653667 RepID=S9VZQ7_SCHCR|nr:ubiquitin-protein ligase E4 [Schizosaccharomyces cryophilus OY26]EPY51744.1 ubiquitin-protein ligase E4 [Schizosaccharomyces cryophilus OY26]